MTKADLLPETWEQKFARYKDGEERVYKFRTKKELREANEAVQCENNKKERYFSICIRGRKFSIVCEKECINELKTEDNEAENIDKRCVEKQAERE